MHIYAETHIHVHTYICIHIHRQGEKKEKSPAQTTNKIARTKDIARVMKFRVFICDDFSACPILLRAIFPESAPHG